MSTNGIIGRRTFLGAVAGTFAAPAIGRAQAWPNKPVRVVNAYSAGGTAGRRLPHLLKKALGERLGQGSFTVGQQAGCGGTIAAQIVARAQRRVRDPLRCHGAVGEPVAARGKAYDTPVGSAADRPDDADAGHADAQCTVPGEDRFRADRARQEQAGCAHRARPASARCSMFRSSC